jgi:hypothetical protein
LKNNNKWGHWTSVAALAMLGLSTAALADKPGYGPAGCGLGSMIMGNGTGFSQIFAATTNSTTYSQTSGITSGTSNCDQHGSEQARVSVFIQGNRDALARDMSRGSGETLSALSDIAGCSSAAAVGSALQAQFRTAIPSAQISDAAVSASIVDVLQSTPALSCEAIG